VGRRSVAAVSVDGGGVVSVYHGDDHLADWQAPGEDLPLSSSVQLDATLGRETIHVYLCREPIDLDPIVRALRADRLRPPAHEGCEREVLRIDKRETR